MNDAVTFRSSKFSLEPPLSDAGRPYDLPLGDDLAEFLAGRITIAHRAVQVSPVTREDFGSVFDLKVKGHTYTVTIIWLADPKHEDRWGIQFSHPVGFWGFILGRRSRPEACRAAQRLVAEALAASPETFSDVEWLSQDDFHKRM